MVRSTARSCAQRWLLVFILGAICTPAAVAQQSGSIDEVLAAGAQMERQRNWRDAIDHYEESLEVWPDDNHLTYGLRRAKFQYSIDRRYSDESFRQQIKTKSRDEALLILDDILHKIQSRFVEPISLDSVISHGTESLWLALGNDRFVEENLFGADPERVQQMRRTLREDYWNRPIARSGGARRTVIEVCNLGERLLHLDGSAVVMEYVFGATNCLDDYSNVLTPTRYSDLFSNIDGEFVGVGIVLEGKLGQGMELLDVLPDSPAEDSGLLPGEWIIGIDGVDCRFLSTDEAANLLTGQSGSRVELEIADVDGAKRTVDCSRRQVNVSSIPVATMLDTECGVGYLRMSQFQKNTVDELDTALFSLQQQGMKSLVWDLRGNPGGLLREAVYVLDRFIDDGVLVSTQGRTPEQNETFRAFGPGTWRIPLVLLIDGHSASASEIVAGAIRDHDRGTIIGRTSYGKWSVQSIYPGTDGMGLRLTTARFYSPDGNTFSKIGIQPDVVVSLSEEAPRRRPSREIDPADDPDLQAALQELCGTAYTRR